jgi:hypothetical protein
MVWTGHHHSTLRRPLFSETKNQTDEGLVKISVPRLAGGASLIRLYLVWKTPKYRQILRLGIDMCTQTTIVSGEAPLRLRG